MDGAVRRSHQATTEWAARTKSAEMLQLLSVTVDYYTKRVQLKKTNKKRSYSKYAFCISLRVKIKMLWNLNTLCFISTPHTERHQNPQVFV